MVNCRTLTVGVQGCTYDMEEHGMTDTGADLWAVVS